MFCRPRPRRFLKRLPTVAVVGHRGHLRLDLASGADDTAAGRYQLMNDKFQLNSLLRPSSNTGMVILLRCNFFFFLLFDALLLQLPAPLIDFLISFPPTR